MLFVQFGEKEFRLETFQSEQGIRKDMYKIRSHAHKCKNEHGTIAISYLHSNLYNVRISKKAKERTKIIIQRDNEKLSDWITFIYRIIENPSALNMLEYLGKERALTLPMYIVNTENSREYCLKYNISRYNKEQWFLLAGIYNINFLATYNLIKYIPKVIYYGKD